MIKTTSVSEVTTPEQIALTPELGPQQRAYDDTFSAFTAVKRHVASKPGEAPTTEIAPLVDREALAKFFKEIQFSKYTARTVVLVDGRTGYELMTDTAAYLTDALISSGLIKAAPTEDEMCEAMLKATSDRPGTLLQIYARAILALITSPLNCAADDLPAHRQR